MKILMINGPNINMLGLREPEIYGSKTYKDLVELVEKHASEVGVDVTAFQSNHEGVIVDEIQNALGKYDAIVINPAAYTHTSIAILDALKSVNIPAVEIHISDISEREDFRKLSYTGLYCEKSIKGRGFDGYLEAIDYFVAKFKS
ncbi:MAG: type II 3-dehydroquinate dehydratase [Gudongella sp.]|jgi:3-dehydroquinate dehydratase-2|nr:type II 3-dehydroquinate dehydratase [Gudongella sp.]